MMPIPALTGLDLLGTAIILVDQDMNVHYANPAAENLFEASSRSFVGHNISDIFQDDVLDAAIVYARTNHCSYTENDLRIGAFGHPKLLLSCTANPVELDGWVEGWRGDVFVALETGPDGRIVRLHPRDPSWHNWPLLEHAILGNIVPDFPLINKSFNLSYAGQDL